MLTQPKRTEEIAASAFSLSRLSLWFIDPFIDKRQLIPRLCDNYHMALPRVLQKRAGRGKRAG
jgi:hypothetical protein